MKGCRPTRPARSPVSQNGVEYTVYVRAINVAGTSTIEDFEFGDPVRCACCAVWFGGGCGFVVGVVGVVVRCSG